MVPQIQRVVTSYGITVVSGSGGDSLTFKHRFGCDHDETEVLHIGDLDPSGIHIFTSLTENVSTGTTAMPWILPGSR